MIRFKLVIATLLYVCSLSAQVPDTPVVSLNNVKAEIGTSGGLATCFSLATPTGFDPTYAKSGNWLSEFRNYRHGVAATFSHEIISRTATVVDIKITVTVAANPPAEALGLPQTAWHYTSTNPYGLGSVRTWVATFQTNALVSEAAGMDSASPNQYTVTFNAIDFKASTGYYITNFPYTFTVPAFQ